MLVIRDSLDDIHDASEKFYFPFLLGYRHPRHPILAHHDLGAKSKRYPEGDLLDLEMEALRPYPLCFEQTSNILSKSSSHRHPKSPFVERGVLPTAHESRPVIPRLLPLMSTLYSPAPAMKGTQGQPGLPIRLEKFFKFANPRYPGQAGSRRTRWVWCKTDPQHRQREDRWRLPTLAPPLSPNAEQQRSTRLPPPPGMTPWILPDNFGAVKEGSIYRSAYPKPEHYMFLKSLEIETIITLVGDTLPAEYRAFMQNNRIRHIQFDVPTNKEGDVGISNVQMVNILSEVFDSANCPILIHCNKGKHRTGCVVACFRKVCRAGRCSEAIFEYGTHANGKERDGDKAFIRQFPTRYNSLEAEMSPWFEQERGRSTRSVADRHMANRRDSSSTVSSDSTAGSSRSSDDSSSSRDRGHPGASPDGSDPAGGMELSENINSSTDADLEEEDPMEPASPSEMDWTAEGDDFGSSSIGNFIPSDSDDFEDTDEINDRERAWSTLVDVGALLAEADNQGSNDETA